MRRFWTLTLALALLCGCVVSSTPWARAGDEDQKEAKKKNPPKQEEETVFPPKEEGDSPKPSLGEDTGPEFTPSDNSAGTGKVTQPGQRRRRSVIYIPDKNIDYAESLAQVETEPLSRGVLPPALGVRGYRPNLVAGSYGDRTPGMGVFLEYSWNRLAAGTFYSYRALSSNTSRNAFNKLSQSFFGIYGAYRFLPFEMSPYISLGLELGSNTDESFGGTAGIGLETKVYLGWTALIGYTHHSTVRRGFLGGAFGWAF